MSPKKLWWKFRIFELYFNACGLMSWTWIGCKSSTYIHTYEVMTKIDSVVRIFIRGWLRKWKILFFSKNLNCMWLKILSLGKKYVMIEPISYEGVNSWNIYEICFNIGTYFSKYWIHQKVRQENSRQIVIGQKIQIS